MTLTQLGQFVGLTAQSLSNAENGRQNLTAPNVRRVADVLRFPVEFFYGSDLEELQDYQLSFRARSKTSNRAKSAVRSSARIAIELKKWIDDRFNTPSIDVPSLDSHLSPQLAAEHVRSRWGLGPTQAVENSIHLLESRGVSVFSLPPDYCDVDAFSFWWQGHPFIMLSTMKSAERSRFDAAHELGHLVLHQNDDYERDWRTAEREANSFAAAFLMPEEGVRQSMHHKQITTDRIIRGRRRWRVAAMALAYRLHDLDLLSEWLYRQSVIELGRLGYRTAEPDGISRESSQLLAKVFAALRTEKVSYREVASQLLITTQDLRDLTFGLFVRHEEASKSELDQLNHSTRPNLRLVQ